MFLTSLYITLIYCWFTFFMCQTPGLNVITEYIMGIVYPGRPIANVCFKTYGYISMSQAISFLSDFKLGHYMKIPTRAMFIVQVYISYLEDSAIGIFSDLTKSLFLFLSAHKVYRNYISWNSEYWSSMVAVDNHREHMSRPTPPSR